MSFLIKPIGNLVAFFTVSYFYIGYSTIPLWLEICCLVSAYSITWNIGEMAQKRKQKRA